VATGYGGNGMTYSSVAATVFKQMILQEESPYIKLFDPNRVKPIAGFTTF
jgi:glycine/D-amino acid oxidase-like deaminating enzyme